MPRSALGEITDNLKLCADVQHLVTLSLRTKDYTHNQILGNMVSGPWPPGQEPRSGSGGKAPDAVRLIESCSRHSRDGSF